MEPVILFIAITAIICTTIVKIKRLNLEKEQMRLGNGQAPKAPLSLAENREMAELRQRIQNLETIVNLGDSSRGNEAQLRQQIAELSQKLEMLGLR
jgi:hypothetical protein